MILEGLLSTVDESGRPHLAAMGPHVDVDITHMELRPFPSSATWQYLQRSKAAVFHVTDDVEQFVGAVIGEQPFEEEWQPAEDIDGFILSTACRAYELKVTYQGVTGTRGVVNCEIVGVHRFRDFFGFNRAKHAVIEASILVSRIEFLPRAEIEAKWNWLKPIVEKTGGAAELRAFERLTTFIEKSFQLTAH